jgi:hypothetical protein
MSFDKTQKDWTDYISNASGVSSARRNLSIYVPIVQNFTNPHQRYDDGTVFLPSAADYYLSGQLNNETGSKNRETPPLVEPEEIYDTLDNHPDWKNGGYFPQYFVNSIHYLFPEFSNPDNRKSGPRIKKYPLDIRVRI